MIAWRLPDILTLAAVVSLLILSLLPPEAAAHGSGHPTELRNARNQFAHLKPQRPAPMMPILAEDGSLLDLGRFRGKLVLLNFWATWCPPCIDDLPALDRLQALLRNDPFAVVALSIDEGDIDIPVSFVRRLGLRSLKRLPRFNRTREGCIPPLWPSDHLSHRPGRVGDRLYRWSGKMGFPGSHEIPESLHRAGRPWLNVRTSLPEPLGPSGKDGVKGHGVGGYRGNVQ